MESEKAEFDLDNIEVSKEQKPLPLPEKKKFRIACKNLCLTYPRCDAWPRDCLEFLIDKLSSYYPTFIQVVRETHEDGGLHLHAMVQTERKMEIKKIGRAHV